MPIKIAPSLLSADFARFGEELRAVDAAGADLIHLDVMDGHFVPALTFGPALIKALRPYARLPFDVHLMIAPPDPYLSAFAEAGADRIAVHVEAGFHPHRSLMAIRALGCQAGIALNPGTPESAIAYLLDVVDFIVVMSVNPGFGGQPFLPTMVEKIRRLRAMLEGRPISMTVDGGVTVDNARLLAEAGADVLVAGTSVFKGGAHNYARNIADLREAAR